MKPIFLWGYMASGKSRLGKRLAQKLDFKFIDLDHFIEQKMNLVIPEIFNQFGESYFRELENEALTELLSLTNTIISCGGGTPCFHDNKSMMLNSGLVIYLDIEEDVLIDRLWRNRFDRPIVATVESPEKLREKVRAHLGERMSYYSQAHLIYDNTIPKSQLRELLSYIDDYQSNAINE